MNPNDKIPNNIFFSSRPTPINKYAAEQQESRVAYNFDSAT